MSNAYNRWLSRVKDTDAVWTEREIIYFRKAVGSAGIQSAEGRATLREIFAARAYVQTYRITQEQSDKGAQYLLSKSLKLDGTKRKGCRLGDRELRILKDVSHHYIVGLHRQGHAEYFLPIYRAVDSKGNTFDYVGGYYEIVEVIA